MNFLTSVQFKVGALVIAVGGLIGYMSMQVSDDPSYLGNPRRAWFLMPSASGLIKNSAVKTAGINVGVIRDIRLQDGQARIEITVKADIPLTTSAAIEVKSIGILGDKHVEISPGSPSDPPLADGAQIMIINDKGSLDNVMSQVGDIAKSLKDVAEVVRESISKDGTDKHVLGRIVKNIENVTEDLKQITGRNKDQISKIIDQVNSITSTVDELVNDDSEAGLKKTWKKTLVRIDSTMKNIDEISSKINRGEGTIGKLINDETTVDELNTAIQGVSGLFDSASRIQTGFDFHGDYLGAFGATKSTIGIQIQPGLDRYYYIGIIDDPAGVVEKNDTTISSAGAVVSDTTTVMKHYNKTRFTAVFAKNFWDWTIKGGLIESSGGFGLDYSFWRKRALISFEAFNFEKANLRLTAKYNLSHGFYLTGGLSDALDKNNQRSGYIGAGLFLTNDDLKLLLTRSPF